MKKLFFIMGLCAFVLAHSSSVQAAGCYITPTNDYICDENNPGASGHDVQRDTRNDVPGSDDVFQSGDVRSQYDWMPGVLMNLGFNIESPPPGTTDVGTIPPGTSSGSGTAQWSGAECEAGTDPRVAAQQLIIAEERLMTQSYYDGLGGHGSCPGGGCVCPAAYKPQNACHHAGTCNYPYCGTNSAGCLTVGVGHLVQPHELSQYSPCGTSFTEEEMLTLFRDVDFPNYWNPAVQQTQDMCLSDSEASCFLVVLTSINFQLGAAWYTRGPYTNHVWDSLQAGRFQEAANRFSSSSYCSQYEHRCNQFVQAIRALDTQGAAGCDGVPNN